MTQKSSTWWKEVSIRETLECKKEYIEWLTEQKNRAYHEYFEYCDKLNKQGKLYEETKTEARKLGIDLSTSISGI